MIDEAGIPATRRAEQIVAAARRLFVRHGYRRASMDDIAAEAGVAKATLYLHFDGKEAIFRGMLAGCRALIEARAGEAEASDAPLAERLGALLFAYPGTALEWFGDAGHLRELRAIIDQDPAAFGPPAGEDRQEERMIALLRGAASRGEVDPALPDAELARAAAFLRHAATGAKGEHQTIEAYRDRLAGYAAFVARALGPAAP